MLGLTPAEIQGSRVRPTDFVVDENGCWIWQLQIDRAGYGRVRREGRKGGKPNAHRWVYEQLVGPVAEGLDLDHLCRVRACVNPAHLEPVTSAENARRGAKAKITAEIATEIRLRKEPVKAQAERYGLSVHTVDKIRNGRRWANA
jgi:hypothetical protein